MQYFDLAHTFNAQMPVYPGDPVPEFTQVASLGKEGYTDFQIKTGMHVGTHIDAPFHMLEGGKKLSEYEPEKFIGRGVLVDAREAVKNAAIGGTSGAHEGAAGRVSSAQGSPAIGAALLDGKKLEKGDIVLVLTGFSKKFREKEYYEKYPEISEAFARALVDAGVKILGLDTPSPDRPPFTIHKLLLGNEILIIENLTNLEALLPHPSFEVFALPAKFDVEAAPVRVVARIE